jgi:Fe-Mn family superoxide dismutase
MILENKINLLTEKINTSEFLISEMKRIGIEKLPYSQSSLKRFIDSKTMDVHYNGHYKTYVKKLNDALSKKNYGDIELEDMIKSISKYNQTIRNNAGGAFNHALFWKMLSPKKQDIPSEIKNKIIKNFGSVNKFKEEFGETAKDRFGSGWCWLILTKGNKLKIMSTPNQDNPLMNVIEGGGFPLLGLDLWEHAYYLRYQNKRDEYINNFWDVVNWDFVNDLFIKRNKSKLTESVIKEQDQPPANNFILPNGKINPSIFDKLLSEVYPECTPKVITNYDLNKRIPNACFGKIKSSVCETDYGIIGGNYALSQMGGLGEWSAINYFDGNTSVGKQILNLYEKFNSEKSDFETWINKMKKTLFGDNGKFIKSLIKIVIDPATKKGTLDKGIERENTAERILTQRYKKMGITRFCDGDTRDKYKGQDMMTSKDNENKFIQVKSLYELYENTNENGETIFTFKNKNQYKKENINVFAFIKDENNYIFFDFINAEIVDNGNEAEKRYSYIFKPSDEKFRSDNLIINKLNESKSVKLIINKGQIKEIQKNRLTETTKILNEEIETNEKNEDKTDIDNIMKREIQKLRPIPTEMYAAKEAIDNIVTAEVSRGNVNSNRTLGSLFNLDLSKVTLRNKYRLNNYYNRFYKSRTRGLDFEGLIAGLLNAEISEDINTPYDLTTKENQKISLKIVRNLNESPVLKSAKGNIKNFIESYQTNEETKKMLNSQVNNENILSFLISLHYNKIAEDLIDFMLPDIDGLLIGVPNENFSIEIFYFDKDAIKSLALNPRNLAASKTKGSQQLRFKNSVFTENPTDGNKLYGRIYFPIISEEEYKQFFLGDENTKETLNLLNLFGDKYNIKNLGGNLPQDIIHSLASNQNFKQDILKLLG